MQFASIKLQTKRTGIWDMVSGIWSLVSGVLFCGCGCWCCRSVCKSWRWFVACFCIARILAAFNQVTMGANEPAHGRRWIPGLPHPGPAQFGWRLSGTFIWAASYPAAHLIGYRIWRVSKPLGQANNYFLCEWATSVIDFAWLPP